MSNLKLTISTDKVVEFRKIIEKFNNKAKKVGSDGVEVISMENSIKTINKTSYEVYTVELSKPTFSIGNYRVNAVFTNDNGADLVFTFNDYQYDISQEVDYRRCDHCNVKHARKTVVVISENDKEIQVGKSCIKDYMGVSLSTFNWLNDTIQHISDIFYWDIDENEPTSSGQVVYHVENVLAHTYDICSVGGYKNAEHTIPTSYEVLGKVFNFETASTKGHEWAKVAIEMITSMLPTSTYESNVQNLVKAGYVSKKRMAILCSSYVMVSRELEKREKAQNSTSDYVGEEGQRIEFEGTIKVAFGDHGFYGYFVMYIIEDSEGNQFKWISTSEKHQKYAVGDSYKFKGTVKKHEEYKGVKQTIISRCSIK